MIEDPPKQPSILDLIKQYGSVDAPELTDEVLASHGYVRIAPGRVVTKSLAEQIAKDAAAKPLRKTPKPTTPKERPQKALREVDVPNWEEITKPITVVEPAFLARALVQKEVREVQKIALGTDIEGVFSNVQREEAAEQFSKWAGRMLREQDTLTKASRPEGRMPYPIPDEQAEELYQEFYVIVRRHFAAYSKANNDSLENTIFDLSSQSEEMTTRRENYIIELMNMLIENHRLIKYKNGARQLTTYRDPDWVRNWMNGVEIAKHFQKTYPPATVSLLMAPLGKSRREYTAVNAVKNPNQFLDMYAHNLLTVFTDEVIAEHFTDPVKRTAPTPKLAPKDLRELLTILTAERRARLAFNSREKPYEVLDAVARDIFETLTDENIMNYLTSDDAEKRLSAEQAFEVVSTITRRDRIGMAIRTRTPLESVDKVATNILELLTDDAIYSHLTNYMHPERLTGAQAREVVTVLSADMRKRIAVDHINDPQRTLGLIADNLIHKLNDPAIREYLANEIKLPAPKIDLFLRNFTPILRARVAVQHTQQLPHILRSLITGKLREKGFASLAVEKI